jgi:CRISPR-associated protein Cmr3
MIATAIESIASTPTLWVSDIISAQVLSQDYNIALNKEDLTAGHHILAFDDELTIRQIARLLQAVEGANVQVFHPKEPLAQTLSVMRKDGTAMIVMGSLSYPDWLESLKKTPLELEKALDIATDILQTEPEELKYNLALEELRQRVSLGMRREMSQWEWDKKYIEPLRAKLEKDFQLPLFGRGSGGKPSTLDISLCDRLLEILNREQDGSKRAEAFIELQKAKNCSLAAIEKLADQIELEVDLEESRAERASEISNLQKIGKYQLTLSDYLDKQCAIPLEKVAGWLGTTPVAMLTTLYPVIASLLRVGTKLELIKATNFYALPIIYTGIVAESGSGKSPAQKTIIKPLFELQAEAEAEYQQQLENYEQELEQWKKSKEGKGQPPAKPVPREYYTTDATSEAIALILSQQPHLGLFGWFDELVSLFKSQGQYKGGRGADGEKILSGRDGTGLKVNRASGKRISVECSSYSITGSIQPQVLQQMMGDFSDANGQWARFLWSVMPIQPAPYPDGAIVYNISDLLKGIYKRLSNLRPTTYKLSTKAQELYRDWYNKLDDMRVTEARQGLRSVYAKMRGDTGVLALLLHTFNGCIRPGSQPTQEVSAATIEAAIKLAQYHIDQVKLIHSEGDAANGKASAIQAKIIQMSERKGWLKASDVRDFDREMKKLTANDIRSHFRDLEACGFGQTRGDGTRLQWSINPHKDNPPPPQDSSRQTQDNLSLAESPVNSTVETTVEKTQDSSRQTQDNLSLGESLVNSTVEATASPTQDSFSTVTKLVTDSLPKNELDTTDLSLVSLAGTDETQTLDTQEVSTQDKTQDTCLETVLSCLEFAELTPLEADEWMTEENLQDIDGYLSQCKEAQEFAEVVKLCPKDVVRKVLSQQTPEKLTQIKNWSLKLKKAKSQVKVGDICIYCGNNYSIQKLCKTKKLQIVSVSGDKAIVSSQQWHDSVHHEIALSELNLIN